MAAEEGLEALGSRRFVIAAGVDEVNIEVTSEVGGALEGLQAAVQPLDGESLGALGKIDRDDPDGWLPRPGADGLNGASRDEVATLGLEAMRDKNRNPPSV